MADEERMIENMSNAKHITRNNQGKGLALFAGDNGSVVADTKEGRVTISRVNGIDYQVTTDFDSFTSNVMCSVNDAVEYAINMYGEE